MFHNTGIPRQSSQKPDTSLEGVGNMLFCKMCNVTVFCGCFLWSLAPATSCSLTVPSFSRVTFLTPSSVDLKVEELTATDFRFSFYRDAGTYIVQEKWIAVFSCNEPTFTLIGTSYLICMKAPDRSGTLEWSAKIPECKQNTCLLFGDQDKTEFRYNGQKLRSYSGGFPAGTETYNTNCPSGYKLESGSVRRRCLNNGTWSIPSVRCIPEGDACSWSGGTTQDIKLRLKNNSYLVFNQEQERLFPAGTELVDYQVVACPFGSFFKGNSVKVCHRGTWFLSEHPCVPSWNVTSNYFNFSTNNAGLVVWGVTMTLLCSALLFLIFKPCGSLKNRPQKNSTKRSRSRGKRINQQADVSHPPVSTVHRPNLDTNSEGLYSTIPMDTYHDESIYSDATTRSMAESTAIYDELISKLEESNPDQTSTGELPVYSSVIPKAKREVNV